MYSKFVRHIHTKHMHVDFNLMWSNKLNAVHTSYFYTDSEGTRRYETADNEGPYKIPAILASHFVFKVSRVRN